MEPEDLRCFVVVRPFPFAFVCIRMFASVCICLETFGNACNSLHPFFAVVCTRLHPFASAGMHFGSLAMLAQPGGEQSHGAFTNLYFEFVFD